MRLLPWAASFANNCLLARRLGESDEFGFNTTEGTVHVQDLHATLPHLPGFEHTKLSVR